MTKVLIVDDEEMIREELREALEFEDFTVTTAPTAIDAVEICNSSEFDVIVTDLKMPGMGGIEFLRHIKSQNSSAKVFVVSGHGAESSADDALSLGAVACFSKPLNVDLLVDKINEQ